MTTRLFLWSLTSALAGFIFGFDTVVISGAEQKIQALWGLSPGLHGIAMGSALYGTVLGALAGAWPADRFGRKPTLLLIGALWCPRCLACGSSIARGAERCCTSARTATSWDVMPFYHNGEYHVFYLRNAAGNNDINWEHAVSTDLIQWERLPSAIRRDPKDITGPEGGCMFTGSIILHDGAFHAFYTSWNPENPKGREFICHATSTDLHVWTKHPEDMIAPDGIHYANQQARDFRDPCVVWDEQARQFVMYILANKPGNSDWVYGILTSPDLKRWTQKPPIEEIPGDECPDFFKAGDTYYMHGVRVYAFAIHKDGPWQFPKNSKVDRPMAAKRVFDGKSS